GGPDEDKELAVLDQQIEVVDGDRVVRVCLGDVVEGYGRHAREMLLRQRFRAKTLEMGDQLLALGEEAPLREDTRADTALHALDQGRVLPADLVVERDQLVDPLLVDVPREEVAEEPRRPLRAEREARAAREVR